LAAIVAIVATQNFVGGQFADPAEGRTEPIVDRATKLSGRL
jgi:hypothetical protein